jgi:hypothetical protein
MEQIYNSKFRQAISFFAKYTFAFNLHIHPRIPKITATQKREAGYKEAQFYNILAFILITKYKKS